MDQKSYTKVRSLGWSVAQLVEWYPSTRKPWISSPVY